MNETVLNMTWSPRERIIVMLPVRMPAGEATCSVKRSRARVPPAAADRQNNTDDHHESLYIWFIQMKVLTHRHATKASASSKCTVHSWPPITNLWTGWLQDLERRDESTKTTTTTRKHPCSHSLEHARQHASQSHPQAHMHHCCCEKPVPLLGLSASGRPLSPLCHVLDGNMYTDRGWL